MTLFFRSHDQNRTASDSNFQQQFYHSTDFDSITAGLADSLQCSQNLQTSLAICRSLGLPLHPNKCIGPSTCLVVLGIELDSLDQTARLPAEKLMALQELIQSWRTRRWCNRCQLESLIGHLHHAAKEVWPGCTFCGVCWIFSAASALAIILFT